MNIVFILRHTKVYQQTSKPIYIKPPKKRKLFTSILRQRDDDSEAKPSANQLLPRQSLERMKQINFKTVDEFYFYRP